MLNRLFTAKKKMEYHITTCKTPLFDLPSDIWKHGFGILFAVVSVFGTLENFLVLVTLYKFKPLHRLSNKILASLAISDLLSSCILAPVFSVQLLSQELAAECSIEVARRFMTTFFIGSSVLSLALISYDRYLHLTKLQEYNMTTRKVGILVSLCWIIPFLLPSLKYIGDTESIYYATAVLLLVIVLGVVIVCYILILWALHQYGKLQTNKLLTKRFKERRLKAGRTVIIILSCFVLMIFPINVHFITSIIDKDKPKKDVAVGYIIQMSLCLLNSAINPIIYYYRTPNLKLCLKKLLHIRQDSFQLEEGSHTVTPMYERKNTMKL